MKKRIEALEGMRGFMAAQITLRHLAGEFGIPFHPAIAAILAPFLHGPPGHALFFVLAGFGLTRSMMRKSRAGARPRLGPYLAHQWRRVAPPYYVTLALCLVIPELALADGRLLVRITPPDLHQVATHVLFLHSLWPETLYGISGQLWSISLIFQFYLVFPLLFVAMERVDYRLVVVAVTVSWLALRVLLKLLVLRHGISSSVYVGLILCRLPTFAMGMAVAYWFGSSRDVASGRLAKFAPWLAAVLLGGSVVTSRWWWGLETELLLGIGYAALLMAALASAVSGGAIGRFLEQPSMVWLGSISYGLYLTHYLVLSRLGTAYRYVLPHPGLWSDAIFMVAGLALCLLVARTLHRLFERRSPGSSGAEREDVFATSPLSPAGNPPCEGRTGSQDRFV